MQPCDGSMFSKKRGGGLNDYLNSRTEGMSFNATCRVHHISTHTLQDWESRFSELKDTLLLYSLSQSFLSVVIEGDELYTKVGSNQAQHLSEGWTIMLLERSSRFILDLACGEKDKALFQEAIEVFCKLMNQSKDITLLTDGERRYSNILFDICYDLLRNGKRGRPKKVLPKGVQVKLKNKGSQAHKKGPKRQKYQTPKPEHPETQSTICDEDIHANHTEAQNAALRRKNSAFRRKTNTYAKNKDALQRTLDVYWCIHNFVRKHYTTKIVPAVKAGILKESLTMLDMMKIKTIF